MNPIRLGKNPIESLQKAWRVLSPLPAGKKAFSSLIGLVVPYTGSIRPEVVSIDQGRVVVRMRDRRKLRNHLNSLHAIALTNLGEVSCGLALNLQLPPGYAAILKRIETEFLKKGRGTLTCECTLGKVSFGEDDQAQSVRVSSVITDASGAAIARTHTEWKVSRIRGPR